MTRIDNQKQSLLAANEKPANLDEMSSLSHLMFAGRPRCPRGQIQAPERHSQYAYHLDMISI